VSDYIEQYSHEIKPADAGLKPQPASYGFDKANGVDKSHVLTIDELPKHDNKLSPRGVTYIDELGFLPAQHGQIKPPNKNWYQSKTIWFNLIVTAATLATSATPSLEMHMTPEVYGAIASGVAFINALLRIVTGKPIKGSEKLGGGNG
jgi:hypothetical protein